MLAVNDSHNVLKFYSFCLFCGENKLSPQISCSKPIVLKDKVIEYSNNSFWNETRAQTLRMTRRPKLVKQSENKPRQKGTVKAIDAAMVAGARAGAGTVAAMQAELPLKAACSWTSKGRWARTCRCTVSLTTGSLFLPSRQWPWFTSFGSGGGSSSSNKRTSVLAKSKRHFS